MRLKIIVSLLAGLPAMLLAFSTGPPVRRTGAAVDGGLNCTACHVTFAPANSDVSGSVSISFDSPTYTPGVTQMVHVKVRHPLAQRWGFQLSPRPVNRQSIPAGTLAPTSVVRVRCDTTPASDAPCNGALEFAEHLSAPRTSAGAGFTFDVPWTPPSADVGDVIFYFAANASNGDGTPLGDRIYTGAKTISSVSACTAAPGAQLLISGVLNAASGQRAWSPGTMLSIFGSGFAPAGLTRAATPGDISAGSYPQQLACVAVEIDGQRTPISYVQGNQINLQAPAIAGSSSSSLTVIVNPGSSSETRTPAFTFANPQVAAPAFFTLNGSSVAAISSSGDLLADPSLVASGKFAQPGDIVSLFGTGFGSTSPAYAAGEIVTGIAPVTNPVSVFWNGVPLPPAAILYAGLSPGSICGLFQLNIQIPLDTPSGNIAIKVSTAGFSSADGATIPVKSGQ